MYEKSSVFHSIVAGYETQQVEIIIENYVSINDGLFFQQIEKISVSNVFELRFQEWAFRRRNVHGESL